MLKVGLIGVGGIANSHMPGWRASADAELVAGCDVNADTLTAWGDKNEIATGRRYSCPADLINNASIDIVDICVPSGHHAELAIAALDAGKHVLCEKPLASSADQIQQLIRARDRSGKLLMTAQNMRFDPLNQAAKQEVAAGRLGTIYHARGWWLRRGEVPTSPGFIYQRNSGGGPCIDLGVHHLDLMLWLMGHPRAVSVSGTAGLHLANQPGAFSSWGGENIPGDIDVEDFAAGFIRFDNGVTLILEVSWMLHHPQEETGLWLYGTRAGLQLPAARIFQNNNEAKVRYDLGFSAPESPHTSHAAECIAFARAVAHHEPSPVPAEESLQVQLILDSLYASQQSGREVRLD